MSGRTGTADGSRMMIRSSFCLYVRCTQSSKSMEEFIMSRLKFCVSFWATILIAATAMHAQITTGSLSGTVTDTTGALVAGATVNVKGQNGQKYTATTNGEGVYTIPGVQAGTPTYTLTVSAPNFKTVVVQNVKVDVATPATVNAVLQAGRREESV